MGACFSRNDQQSKMRSEDMGRSLDEDSRRVKYKCKILLLGSGESGKSTVLKQMKIIHQNGFTKHQLQGYTPIIYRNVIECARSVVIYMLKTGIDCKENNNRVLMEKILDYNPEPYGPSDVQLTSEIAEAIHQFLKDPIVLKVVEGHMSEFYLMDSAEYFFNNVLRIGSLGYVPSETDVLRARQKSVGITETRFTIGQLSICMFDVGGQRSERKKWIHCFEAVTSIIFCTALSEYDQDLLEYKSQNRMRESLVLFESTINSRWFIRTSVILFLNKIDVFKTKLPKVPLARFFEEYTGGSDVNKAAKYILRKFMQANRARLSVYPHLTQATDTTNIRLVFTTVRETMLQNALKDSGPTGNPQVGHKLYLHAPLPEAFRTPIFGYSLPKMFSDNP